MNKAQGLAYLAHCGYTFAVHHEAYVVHYPHSVARADRKQDIQSAKSKMVRENGDERTLTASGPLQLERIWDEELSSAVQSQAAKFVPVVSAGSARVQGLQHSVIG